MSQNHIFKYSCNKRNLQLYCIYNAYFLSRLHRNSGEWADEPIIQAAADLYGFNIYISSYGNSGVSQLVRATSEQLQHDSSRLLHLRLENSHYTCIEHGSHFCIWFILLLMSIFLLSIYERNCRFLIKCKELISL